MWSRHRLGRWIAILAGAMSLALLSSWSRPARADLFLATNLVTDDPSVNPALLTDPNLKNAWGISATATSPFWVSNNGTGVSTSLPGRPRHQRPDARSAWTVTIPDAGSVTGQVSNPAGAGGFNGDDCPVRQRGRDDLRLAEGAGDDRRAARPRPCPTTSTRGRPRPRSTATAISTPPTSAPGISTSSRGTTARPTWPANSPTRPSRPASPRSASRSSATRSTSPTPSRTPPRRMMSPARGTASSAPSTSRGTSSAGSGRWAR